MIYFPGPIFNTVSGVEQSVALTGRNRTGPPCSVGSRTGHVSGPAAADRSRMLQTTTDDADRRQRAKQYWLIRWASKITRRISLQTTADRQLSQTRLHLRLRSSVLGDVHCTVVVMSDRVCDSSRSPLSVYSELRPDLTTANGQLSPSDAETVPTGLPD